MTRVKPGERKRARAPKTKTGCRTCKLRRVKCDETQPTCLKCSASGRTCDGYLYSPSESDSQKGFRLSSDDTAVSVISRSPGVTFSSCGKEMRSFQFFAEQTRHQLQGAFPCPIWSEDLLRLAYYEPGLRHAVLALSSFHELYRIQGTTSITSRAKNVSHDKAFALTQYNLAIRAITSPCNEQTSSSATVALVSSIIFFSIEVCDWLHVADDPTSD